MNKKAQGFTIVELLIVIVVIAILAAISIAAYTNIQQRARNTQVRSGVNMYYKAFLQYAAVHSAYPVSSGCLGAGYPSDVCWKNGEVVNRLVSSSLDNALAEFIGGTKPTLATSLFPIGIGSHNRAGAIYRTEGTSPEIIYYLQGINQECGMSGATGNNEGGVVTQCTVTLPSL